VKPKASDWRSFAPMRQGQSRRFCGSFLQWWSQAVAYFMVHAPHSFFPLVNGGNEAILYCFVFLYLVAAGAGPISLDRLRGAA
jgi:putative oxidoreductase